MDSLRSIDTINTQNQAYTFIKKGILSLELKPRQRLRGQDLAAKLGISRTPIREALGRLEQEGLVTRDSGWGYVVKAFTMAEVRDLYRVRQALEVEAVCEAIANLDDRVIGLLESVMQQAESSLREARFSDFQLANRRFHGVIAQTTANFLLQQMLRTISDRIQILGALVIRQYSARAREIHEENKRILAALKERDVNMAKEAVCEHIRRAGENFFLYLGKELEVT